jgi:glycosyltransferase involved in cell wall biosynthesis
MNSERRPVGIWVESPRGAQWAGQGMTRLLGFIIEGIAAAKSHVFRIVVTDEIRDEAEADFDELVAQNGVDFTFHSPRDVGEKVEFFDDLARYANEHVTVDAWISLFPNQTGAQLLDAPVSTIFPDAIGLAYHDFDDVSWGANGPSVTWKNRVAATLKTVNNVITFSSHVARDHVTGFFGVSPDRIRVIPHAPPTLEGILPFVRNAERTDETRFRAAEMLRRHAAQQGLHYLIDFPFEHVRFAAVSTQDRVTKNIRVAVEAIELLVRSWHEQFKLIMTAQVHFGSTWTPTPAAIELAQLQFDVLSMPDLPREVHAAFYHCAEVTVHPSVFEGGRGVFPYYESISVGTPCLMAGGPHVAEFMKDAPELKAFVFDPSDAHQLARLLLDTSMRRDEVTALQSATVARLRQRTWGDVAREYVDAATIGVKPLGGKYRQFELTENKEQKR